MVFDQGHVRKGRLAWSEESKQQQIQCQKTSSSAKDELTPLQLVVVVVEHIRSGTAVGFLDPGELPSFDPPICNGYPSLYPCHRCHRCGISNFQGKIDDGVDA